MKIPAAICAFFFVFATVHVFAEQHALHDGQHDFDFEFGAWNVTIRALVHPLSGSRQWVQLRGTHVVRKIWNGRANLGVLEVDGPAGHDEGLQLRLYNPETRQWSLSFASSKDGKLQRPSIGSFANGRGVFYDRELFEGRAILARSVTSGITRSSYRDEIAFSEDGGRTWQVNWIALYTKIDDEN